MKPKKRTAFVSSFADAPDAKVLLAHYKLPAAFAKRGIYVVAAGQADWLGEKYPERKLPKRVADNGLMLVAAILEEDRARAALAGEPEVGFHPDLDAKVLRKAFEDEGFRVESVPISKLAGISCGPDTNPWPSAVAILKAGEVEITALLSALEENLPKAPPPDSFLTLLASKLSSRDEVRALRRVLQSSDFDLIEHALPLIAKQWKPKKAKTKPRGLPPELTKLLSAVDGIPAIGVLSATGVAELHAYLLNLTKDVKQVGKRDWGTTPKEVRIDKMWREGWIPFCVRPDDERIALDLDPATKGRKHQIIGVQLAPGKLTRYGASLADWLWNELEESFS